MSKKCGDCGTRLEHKDGYWECPECGFAVEDDEYEDYDYDEYRKWADTGYGYEGPSDNDMPEGCAACGGDYPNCVDSCPMFDD